MATRCEGDQELSTVRNLRLLRVSSGFHLGIKWVQRLHREFLVDVASTLLLWVVCSLVGFVVVADLTETRLDDRACGIFCCFSGRESVHCASILPCGLEVNHLPIDPKNVRLGFFWDQQRCRLTTINRAATMFRAQATTAEDCVLCRATAMSSCAFVGRIAEESWYVKILNTFTRGRDETVFGDHWISLVGGRQVFEIVGRQHRRERERERLQIYGQGKVAPLARFHASRGLIN